MANTDGRFQTMMAELGRQIDEAVVGYNTVSTHRVVLRKGGEEVASFPVPLGPVQDFVERVKDAVNGAKDALVSLTLHVDPIEKEPAAVEPPPPEPPKQDATLGTGGLDTELK